MLTQDTPYTIRPPVAVWIGWSSLFPIAIVTFATVVTGFTARLLAPGFLWYWFPQKRRWALNTIAHHLEVIDKWFPKPKKIHYNLTNLSRQVAVDILDVLAKTVAFMVVGYQGY
jgi:hypothetical protein